MTDWTLGGVAVSPSPPGRQRLGSGIYAHLGVVHSKAEEPCACYITC